MNAKVSNAEVRAFLHSPWFKLAIRSRHLTLGWHFARERTGHTSSRRLHPGHRAKSILTEIQKVHPRVPLQETMRDVSPTYIMFGIHLWATQAHLLRNDSGTSMCSPAVVRVTDRINRTSNRIQDERRSLVLFRPAVSYGRQPKHTEHLSRTSCRYNAYFRSTNRIERSFYPIVYRFHRKFTR